MHTYYKEADGSYVVVFEYDHPADTNVRVIKSFAQEWLAAAYVAYLNGGVIGGEYEIFFPGARVDVPAQSAPVPVVAAEPEPEPEPARRVTRR